ncbi:hypothetical protein KKF63_10295 [bacterium]|nr:hypothetical protein [bacterium]
MTKSFISMLSVLVILLSMTTCGGGSSSTDSTVPSYTGSWDDVGGPIGGLGYDVRINPEDNDIMFVTDNYAGVGYSTDGGETWTRANQGINIKTGPTEDSVPIFSLTIDPNDPDIVWAGTDAGEGSNFGVYKSIDSGANWTLKADGISKGEWLYLTFRGFTIEPGNSNVVYAQAEVHTEQGGKSFEEVKGRIFKTTDGGENWTLIWDGDSLARYLIIDPDDTDILYASTGIFDREAYNSDCNNDIPGGVGVIKSTDGGTTWNQVNSGLDDLFVGSLRMHPTDSQILFAATGSSCSTEESAGLYRTTNGGTSWTNVISGFALTAVNFASSNPNIVYAAGMQGFYRSTDGGTTWTKYDRDGVETWGAAGMNGGVPIDVTVHPEDENMLYANAYGGGVLRSTDGAQTWELWSDGFSGAILYDIHAADYDTATIYVAGRSGPFKSSDYGTTWEGIANYDTIVNEWMTVSSHESDSEIVFLSLEGEVAIYRSNDGGDSFTLVKDNASINTGIKSFAYAPSDPNIIYAGAGMSDLYPSESYQNTPTGNGFFKSTDTGNTFSEVSTDLTGVNWRKIRVDPVDANTAYAATSSGLYKTTNGGTNWTRYSGLGEKILADVIIDFDNSYFVVSEMFGGIYVSDDAGKTWTGPHNTGMNNGNPFVGAMVFDPENKSVIYAADTYAGVYKSIDKGKTWSAFPDDDFTGMTNRSAKDIVITKDALYIATMGSGVYRYVRE